MANAQKVSRSRVQRAFSRYGIQPDLYSVDVESLNLDGDVQFSDRVSSIAGLFYTTLSRMLALVVRRRPSYLARTATSINGTRTSCADLVGILKQLESYVIGRLDPSDSDLVLFLNAMDSRVPPENEVHLLTYWRNQSACPSQTMGRWLTDHPRFKLHFTPNPLQGTCWTDFVQSVLMRAAAGRAFSVPEDALQVAALVKQWQATHDSSEPVGSAIAIG